jgi:hypothetical protein
MVFEVKEKDALEREAAARLLRGITRDRRCMRYFGYAGVISVLLCFFVPFQKISFLGVGFSLGLFRFGQVALVVFGMSCVKLQLWRCPRCKRRFFASVQSFRFDDVCSNCGMNL